MDYITPIKRFVVPGIWGLIAVIASAGAMNTGIGIYIAAGIANILINGYAIYKYIKNHEEV